MNRFLALLLTVMSGAALAQTTGTVNPSPAPEPSVKEDAPPGGCMPIGLTASGEIVRFNARRLSNDNAEMPSSRNPLLCKRSPPQSNRKAWRQ
jgi:hypothetical protein